MPAGRPYNSNTPEWRSQSAVRVRAYRFVTGDQGNKADCAKRMGLSRTTVHKWWDRVAWTSAGSKNYDEVEAWILDCMHYRNLKPERCAATLGLPLDVVKYEYATHELIGLMLNEDTDYDLLAREIS